MLLRFDPDPWTWSRSSDTGVRLANLFRKSATSVLPSKPRPRLFGEFKDPAES